MRENIELTSYKLYVSGHDRVVTDANHENMPVFVVLEGALRLEEEDLRFVILAVFAVCLREDAIFLLRPSPRNFFNDILRRFRHVFR